MNTYKVMEFKRNGCNYKIFKILNMNNFDTFIHFALIHIYYKCRKYYIVFKISKFRKILTTFREIFKLAKIQKKL